MSSSHSVENNRNEIHSNHKMYNEDDFDDNSSNDDNFGQEEEDHHQHHPIIIDDVDDDNDYDNEDSRVILHFDLDAFYVACERELNPQLREKPVAVSQYNPYGTLEEKSSQDIQGRWVVQADTQQQQQKQHNGGDANGSLIAVSYEARAAGVKRNQRGKEACSLCKNLNIVQVPVKHGKADLTMYRTASKRVMEALQSAVLHVAATSENNNTQSQQQQTKQKSSSRGESKLLFEIASIDEAYMDITVLANRLVEQVILQEESSSNLSSSSSSTLWKSILDAAAPCTTIGGIEVLSKAAQATNALDKDEIRRGSHVQVLDSKGNTVDSGSQAWWGRHQSKFTSSQLRLACGAYLAAKARKTVQSSFDGDVFTLSGGISTNKTLAKLASGLKKPNRQTLIYRDPYVLQKLFHPLPLGRIGGLGGKFGIAIANHLNIQTLGQLSGFSFSELQKAMKGMDNNSSSSSSSSSSNNNNKTAQFLYDISKGLCRDEVTPRNKPKSIECSKTFRGHLAINVDDKSKLSKWVGELCSELQERLQQDRDDNNRTASTIKVSVGFQLRGEKRSAYVSKQSRAPRTLERYPTVAIQMIQQLIDSKNQDSFSKNLQITGLGVGGMQFVTVAEGSSSILAAIQKQQEQHTSSPPLAALSSSSSSLSKKSKINSIVLLGTKQRPSMMEQWLQDSSSKMGASDDNIRKDVTTRTTNSEPSYKRAKTGSTVSSTVKGSSSSSTMMEYLSSKEGKFPPSSSPLSMLPPPVSVPQTMDEIDTDVFEALPKDVQRAVLGDIRYQQHQRNKGGKNRNHHEKRGGIQFFFEAQNRKKK